MAAVMIGNLSIEVIIGADGPPRLKVQSPIYGVETEVTREDLGKLALYVAHEGDKLSDLYRMTHKED